MPKSKTVPTQWLWKIEAVPLALNQLVTCMPSYLRSMTISGYKRSPSTNPSNVLLAFEEVIIRTFENLDGISKDEYALRHSWGGKCIRSVKLPRICLSRSSKLTIVSAACDDLETLT